MNIAFCINRLGLAGLGSTASSLIRNCSDSEKLKFWFFCAGLNINEKNHITFLLKAEEFLGEHVIIDFDPKAVFGSFCSLHGDWTPYGRLLIPDFVTENTVLYLDSDLVVEIDVLELKEFDFGGSAVAAVTGCLVKDTLENKFYIDKIGLTSDLMTFNSGVLLLNIKEWNSKKVKATCLEIGNQYPMELVSCDQTLLNAIFAGKFAKLPPSFNCEWPANKSKPKISGKMILHFVGSPKPWDPLGFLVHNGFRTWVKYMNKEWAFTRKLKLGDLKRAWNIRRSYVRSILNRIKRQ